MTFRSPLDAQRRPGRSPEAVRAYAAMNTVRALERLAQGPVSVSELAESLHIAPRTARRLLRRLELEGYAAASAPPQRRYRPTLRLAALGRRAIDQSLLARAAGPIVAALARQTRAEARLWIPVAPDVCCVLTAAGDGATTVPEPMLGARSPAWANAPGRALLAHDPDLAVAVLADRLEPDRGSAIDPRELAAELQEVRSAGYATIRDGGRRASGNVAAVVAVDRRPDAALEVVVGADAPDLAQAAPHVVRAARQLSDALHEPIGQRPRTA